MIVRVFHNKNVFDDVVYVIVHDREVVSYIKKDNITKLLDKDDNIAGYNIIDSTYSSEQNGYQTMTYDMLRFVNKHLNRVFQEELIHDFKCYIVVGHVQECEMHPDSDHMHVCKVDIGSKVVEIVCGAHNIAKGQRVVVCLENAVLDGKLIVSSTLRGIKSEGMIASAYELGIQTEFKKGILVLDESHSIGTPFMKG